MGGGKGNASSNCREIEGTARIRRDVEIEVTPPIVTDHEENRIGARRQLDRAFDLDSSLGSEVRYAVRPE